MTFNTITNSIKNKINNLQRADQKRTLKLKDLVLIPEFETLLPMDNSVVVAMTESIKTEGFKEGHELHVWYHEGKNILIDGFTRRHCAMKAGLTSVPCIIHHFDTLEQARLFAVSEQKNRRNLNSETLLRLVSSLDFSKGKGNTGDIKGKSSEILGQKLNVSSKTIEKARVVLREANEEQREAIKNNKLSINQVFNQIRAKNPVKKPDTSQPKPSAKENAFIDGIHYAIAKINSGTELKDLYHQITESFDYSKMTASLKNIDFSNLFNSEDSESKE